MLSNFSKITPDRKKCQVMQVGRKVPDKWNLGEMFIKNTTSYKYHGDVITSDGKNEKNITARENKLHGIVRQINTSASSDVGCVSTQSHKHVFQVGFTIRDFNNPHPEKY